MDCCIFSYNINTIAITNSVLFNGKANPSGLVAIWWFNLRIHNLESYLMFEISTCPHTRILNKLENCITGM